MADVSSIKSNMKNKKTIRIKNPSTRIGGDNERKYWTSLHLAHYGHVDAIRALPRRRADFAEDEDGLRPIDLACMKGFESWRYLGCWWGDGSRDKESTCYKVVEQSEDIAL